jgi:PAS domain S-box-containing protein
MAKILVGVSLDAIIMMDHEGKIRGFDRAAERIFGYPEAEVIGKPMAELIIPPALRQRHKQGLARYLATGEGTLLDKRLEMPALRADGSEFIAELTVTRAPVDGPPMFTGYLRDITDRKLAEEAIREREEQIRLLLNSTAEAIYGIDLQGNCTFSNPACARLLGYADHAELLGKNMHTLIHHTRPDGAPFPEQACRIHQAFRRGDGTHVDDEVLWRADGTSFAAEYWSFPIRRHAEVIGTVVTFIDITERKRAEVRLREQAAFLDKATDTILVRDLQDRITFWNPSAENLYGWTAAEAIGKNAFELLFKTAPPALEDMRQTLTQRGEWKGEVQQVTKLGKEIIVLSRWTLIRDQESQPQSVLVISTDITEKKTLETQHHRAQRMESLGILAGGIAHDLNNVLTPIMMAIEFLKMKLPDQESQPLLKTLQDSAERGAAMVKQVLSFARGTEGNHVPISLRNACKECQRMLEHTLPKSIQLEFSLPADVWLIAADATQISQVVMNLCVNARDAMPHAGRLSITGHNQRVDEYYAQMHPDARPGPYVVLSVSDTGTGIPPEILDKIFNPFFTTKKQGEGTGLGLSTVLGIVKSHGGFVTVYSQVGEGTRISVYLPAETAAVEHTAAEPNPLPRGQGELILVVDDELAICEITKATLEIQGYRALTASDGAEAVALLLENRGEIKLVLTDMSMPVMDGAATIRALRKIDPHLPIIAATGLTVGGQTGVVQAGGVQAFLRKPYTADKLLTILREVLDQSCDSDHGSLQTIPSRTGLTS